MPTHYDLTDLNVAINNFSTSSDLLASCNALVEAVYAMQTYYRDQAFQTAKQNKLAEGMRVDEKGKITDPAGKEYGTIEISEGDIAEKVTAAIQTSRLKDFCSNEEFVKKLEAAYEVFQEECKQKAIQEGIGETQTAKRKAFINFIACAKEFHSPIRKFEERQNLRYRSRIQKTVLGTLLLLTAIILISIALIILIPKLALLLGVAALVSAITSVVAPLALAIPALVVGAFALGISAVAFRAADKHLSMAHLFMTFFNSRGHLFVPKPQPEEHGGDEPYYDGKLEAERTSVRSPASSGAGSSSTLAPPSASALGANMLSSDAPTPNEGKLLK